MPKTKSSAPVSSPSTPSPGGAGGQSARVTGASSTATMAIRLTQAEKQSIQADAAAEGITISEWARRRFDGRVGVQPEVIYQNIRDPSMQQLNRCFQDIGTLVSYCYHQRRHLRPDQHSELMALIRKANDWMDQHA